MTAPRPVLGRMPAAFLFAWTAVAAASCTVLPPAAAPNPSRHPVAVQQGPDGRFMACTACEPPTPKSLPLATQTRQAGRPALTSPPTPPHRTSTPASSPTPRTTTSRRIEHATLTFAHGAASLDPRAQRALLALKPLLVHASTVRIVGFTDNAGSQPANDRIAEARALSVLRQVRDLLGSQDRSGPALSATGQGKCCYLNDNASPLDRALNRRVELVLTLEDSDVSARLVARHADLLSPRPSPRTSARTSTSEVAHDARAHP